MPGDDNADCELSQAPDPPAFRPFHWMRDVTATEGLTGDGTAVALALATMQRRGKIEVAAAATIAGKAHLPKRTAERGMAELREAGLLEVLKRYGKRGRLPNGYRLVETFASTRHTGGKAVASTRHTGGKGARHIGGAGCPPYWRGVLEEKKGGAGRLSSTQRAAALAAQASEHRRQDRANGADPTADC